RDPLVTGVQTCALPISAGLAGKVGVGGKHGRELAARLGALVQQRRQRQMKDVTTLHASEVLPGEGDPLVYFGHVLISVPAGIGRSEERRVGRGWGEGVA